MGYIKWRAEPGDWLYSLIRGISIFWDIHCYNTLRVKEPKIKMEYCNRYDVNGQSCLFVSGIDEKYSDDDIIDIFKVHGDIVKCIRVPNELSKPKGRVLVQYRDERAIARIDPDFLDTTFHPDESDASWHITAIQEEIAEELRNPDELKFAAAVAGISKTSLIQMLQTQLSNLQMSGNTASDEDINSNVPKSPQRPSCLDESLINPPSVQRVVVEHVIKTESQSSYVSKIRTFSGRTPKPNGEVDYETWHTQVELLLSDPSSADTQKVRKILDSLLSPASDLVKSLGIDSLPTLYLTQLDAAFGVVADGEELYAAFLSTNQNAGEKPSDYLNRLHLMLDRAITGGGVSTEGSHKQLIRQFCRGCWDQTMLIELQLEHQKTNPPSFPELLLLLRKQEERRLTKLNRMKKHLGSAKAMSHMHTVYGLSHCDEESDEAVLSQKAPAKQSLTETQKLAQEVAELKKQLASYKPASRPNEPHHVENLNENAVRGNCMVSNVTNHRMNMNTSNMPRAWFCFKCGEDGHIAALCLNEQNPAAVRQKNLELRERREQWRMQHQGQPEYPLNL